MFSFLPFDHHLAGVTFSYSTLVLNLEGILQTLSFISLHGATPWGLPLLVGELLGSIGFYWLRLFFGVPCIVLSFLGFSGETSHFPFPLPRTSRNPRFFSPPPPPRPFPGICAPAPNLVLLLLFLGGPPTIVP